MIASAWNDLIEVSPELLAVALIAGVLYANRGRLAALVDRISLLEVRGVKVQFSEPLREVLAAKGTSTSNGAATATRNLETELAGATQIAGARILWVDDMPANNRSEMLVLERLGASVTLVRSTAEAETASRTDLFDLVISDWNRPGDVAPDAPAGLLARLPAVSDARVIFYVGVRRDVPPGAFGLTVHPDELLTLLIAALRPLR